MKPLFEMLLEINLAKDPEDIPLLIRALNEARRQREVYAERAGLDEEEFNSDNDDFELKWILRGKK